MTGDKAFMEYEKTLAEIDKKAHEAREQAKARLREHLKSLRLSHHAELKTIRVIEQKTKRR